MKRSRELLRGEVKWIEMMCGGAEEWAEMNCIVAGKWVDLRCFALEPRPEKKCFVVEPRSGLWCIGAEKGIGLEPRHRSKPAVEALRSHRRGQGFESREVPSLETHPPIRQAHHPCTLCA